MSYMLDKRNAAIEEDIGELIKSLTNFDESDENFSICQQYTLNTIKHHRQISVNGHEVRRQLDSFVENLQISNCDEQAVEVKELYDSVISDPICTENYERDIHWSILCLLINLANNPVRTLQQKILQGKAAYTEIVPPLPEKVPEDERNRREIISELQEDCIAVENIDDDDDLSDWSEDECEKTEDDRKVMDIYEENIPNFNTSEDDDLPNKLMPPKKEIPFKKFDVSKSENWIKEYAQSSWWHNPQSKADVLSAFQEEAHFCELWSKSVSRTVHTFGLTSTCTVSEYCLIREILWMFSNPTDCKFFKIENDQIVVNEKVSLASVTEKGLETFLRNFTKIMTIVYRLRNFARHVDAAFLSTQPPHTYECYLSGLLGILDNFETFIIDKEKEIAEQRDDLKTSVISLYSEMQPHFRTLEYLFDIHKSSVLDWNKYPPHICTSHLLAGLSTKLRSAGNLMKSNLAFVLLMSSMKVFFNIIEIWWTKGTLIDYRDEFLVEISISDETSLGSSYAARLFSKCRNRSFHINSVISNAIEGDEIIQLLLHNSLQAGYTLNVLYSLDRIGELKECKVDKEDDQSLYEKFLDQIINQLSNFKTITDQDGDENIEKIPTNNLADISHYENLKNKLLESDDEMLLMVFDKSFKMAANIETDDDQKQPKKTININELYQKFNNFSNFLALPLENVLYDTIELLLETKISAANKFVMKIFKEEFLVQHHLQNIRKVLLLESSDLMGFFYTKLFEQIEVNENWANPYLLTIQLNDIMSPRFNDMTSLFSIEISSKQQCKTSRVLDAIDEINVVYNASGNLEYLINEQTLASYNSIFRFLLKVKWAIYTLEMLQFPETYKKRLPYAEVQITDLLIKRLSLSKFWIIYAIQCIHSHLMTHVLQSSGMEFDQDLENATNLTEMIAIHKNYIDKICDHCFQNDMNKSILEVIMQFLNLTYVLRDEWQNVCSIMDSDETGGFDDSAVFRDAVLGCRNQVDEIEKTYIRCHKQLTEILNKAVYGRNRIHLEPLFTAFVTSVPY